MIRRKKKKHRPEPLCIPPFKLLMNEKYSVKPSSVQMELPRTHLSPLGTSEDSPVIKGESHRCNTSKSLLAKWKKKRRGVERGGGEIRPFRKKKKEERGDLNQSGFKGLVVKTNAVSL